MFHNYDHTIINMESAVPMHLKFSQLDVCNVKIYALCISGHFLASMVIDHIFGAYHGIFFARENKLVWLVQLFDSRIESSPREDPPISGTAEPHFIHEISKATWRQTQ